MDKRTPIVCHLDDCDSTDTGICETMTKEAPMTTAMVNNVKRTPACPGWDDPTPACENDATVDAFCGPLCEDCFREMRREFEGDAQQEIRENERIGYCDRSGE